jgi:hypothetical protein
MALNATALLHGDDMANALIDIIPRRNVGFSGPEGDLINQNADQNTPVSAPSQVINNNTLASLMQPQNFIRNNRTGNYVTPQGTESVTPVNFQSQGQPNDGFDYSNPISTPGGGISYKSKTDPLVEKVIQDGEMHIINAHPVYTPEQRMQQLQMQHLAAQTAALSDIKPKYEPSNNSFIIPPDAQHPNGQVIPAGGAGGAPSVNNLSGDALLSALPKPQADQVKALAEGRMQFPAGFALKSPYWQDMISKVSQYDPNFDAVNYNARSQTRNDFTKGPSANNVTALNTAIQHLGHLDEAFSQLGNTSIPAYNTVSNWLGNQTGNADIQKNYSAVAADSTAVAHELAKVFRQSGMSEGEIKDWESKISPNNSPEQMKSTIQSALGLMQGRLEALGARYNQGMGTTASPYQLLTPEAQKTYSRLSGTPVIQQPIQANPLSVTAPDGSVHTFPNAAAADGFRKAIGQ